MVTNHDRDPWDTEVPTPAPPRRQAGGPRDRATRDLRRYGNRRPSQDPDFSDQVALDRCLDNVRTAITHVLGWVEAAAPAGLDQEAKHQTIMQQLRGMPIEMLDRAYNRYRIENQDINLDDHPEYRIYQTLL